MCDVVQNCCCVLFPWFMFMVKALWCKRIFTKHPMLFRHFYFFIKIHTLQLLTQTCCICVFVKQRAQQNSASKKGRNANSRGLNKTQPRVTQIWGIMSHCEVYFSFFQNIQQQLEFSYPLTHAHTHVSWWSLTRHLWLTENLPMTAFLLTWWTEQDPMSAFL